MEVEYEVECVVKAKVFMKGKKMGWKFYVKWKGYEHTDNTWEPFKSFESCGEEIIQRFWDRVDTKDRDVDSIEGWTNGEEVYPMGPPRRKNKTTPKKSEQANTRSSGDEHPIPGGSANGTTTKRPLEHTESQGSSKRKRASSSRRKSDTQLTRRSRRETHPQVPDSDPEREMFMDTSPSMAANDMLVGLDASGQVEELDLGNPVPSSASGQPEETRRHPSLPLSSRVSNHVESQPSTQTTANEINPSLLSGPHLEVDQPIELDAPQMPGAKNGTKGIKGRNASLLTFNKKKGALETLKRNRPVRDSQAVADAEQVLELPEFTSAAFGSTSFHSGPSIGTPLQDGDGNAAAAEQTSHDDAGTRLLLADYEEQDQPCPASPSFELPDKMPTSISFPEPSSGGSSPWKRSTIFGPLSTGTGLPAWATSPTLDAVVSPSNPGPFLLSLDNSISVPVALKDVSSEANLLPGTSGPPGKLYTSLAATALLETLETGGPCARLVPGDTATVEQCRVFDALSTKLGEGGLFIVMASSGLLACCSSTNEDYTKKLELSTALRGLSGTVVVSHVKVANHSAFADAAAQAENVRW